MVFNDSSEISLSIRNAVRHLKQLGNSNFISQKKSMCSFLFSKGESFRANTQNDEDLSNIDLVADTLMALVTETYSSLSSFLHKVSF